MKRPLAPVIGSLDDQGRAKPFPGVKVAGDAGRFLDCPDCGERLDKEDLGSVLEHEKVCTGIPG